jgi:septal ring factor EnvC (AmiA/AmiB activator)
MTPLLPAFRTGPLMLANPHIVLVDDNGKLGTMAVNEIGIKTNAQAMLNELLKEHLKVEELEATVAQQQKQIETLTALLKKQSTQIQKVSAQLEISKPVAKVVVNKP